MHDSQRDDPVTVLVTRRPLPGKEAEFRAYLEGITKAASVQPGHLGSTIFRPAGPKGRTYRVLFRFDKRSNLDRWESSAERQRWREIASTVSEPREAQIESGLEAWFDITGCEGPKPPSRPRQALVVWLGIYLTVLLLSYLLMPLIAHWPLPLRTLLFTGVVVLLMTWVIMPRLSRWLAWWLHPADKSRPQKADAKQAD